MAVTIPLNENQESEKGTAVVSGLQISSCRTVSWRTGREGGVEGPARHGPSWANRVSGRTWGTRRLHYLLSDLETSLGQPELKVLAAPGTQRMDLGPCLQAMEARGLHPSLQAERGRSPTHLNFSWWPAEAHVHDISCCSGKKLLKKQTFPGKETKARVKLEQQSRATPSGPSCARPCVQGPCP